MCGGCSAKGTSGSGESFNSIGKKEIDGKTAVGFREASDAESMTLWADPQTSRLVRLLRRIRPLSKKRQTTVMRNFRYDMELDPSLFSLEPPARYTTAVDDDLVYTLRFLAEHNNGIFPPEFGLSNYMQPIQAAVQQERERLVKTPSVHKAYGKA